MINAINLNTHLFGAFPKLRQIGNPAAVKSAPSFKGLLKADTFELSDPFCYMPSDFSKVNGQKFLLRTQSGNIKEYTSKLIPRQCSEEVIRLYDSDGNITAYSIIQKIPQSRIYDGKPAVRILLMENKYKNLVKGAGTVLHNLNAERSFELGCEGRIELQSIPSAITFHYLCGFLPESKEAEKYIRSALDNAPYPPAKIPGINGNLFMYLPEIKD